MAKGLGKIRKYLKNDATIRRKVMNGVREDVYFWFDGDNVPSQLIQDFGRYKGNKRVCNYVRRFICQSIFTNKATLRKM